MFIFFSNLLCWCLTYQSKRLKKSRESWKDGHQNFRSDLSTSTAPIYRNVSRPWERARVQTLHLLYEGGMPNKHLDSRYLHPIQSQLDFKRHFFQPVINVKESIEREIKTTSAGADVLDNWWMKILKPQFPLWSNFRPLIKSQWIYKVGPTWRNMKSGILRC